MELIKEEIGTKSEPALNDYFEVLDYFITSDLFHQERCQIRDNMFQMF